MFVCLLKRFILGCACALYFSGALYAAPLGSSWESWFKNQVMQHPDVVSAKEKMNADFSIADGRERPLYNPELETEFEREGKDDNYLVGINQTIDWMDKLGVQKQQADYLRTAARQAFELMVQQKTAAAFKGLIEWQAASQQAEIARNQEEQLDTLLNLIKQRQQTGDLGQVDAELAFLSLTQRFNASAQAQARLKQAGSNLQELLIDWSPKWARIPDRFWLANKALFNSPKQANQWVDKHPQVKAARADWEVSQQAAELALLETRADPTIGINAGESGKDNVVGLTLSIPLNIRNNFSAQARAASQEALSAEAQYQAIRRKQQFAIETAQAVLQEYRNRYQRWQSLMQGREERSKNLLENQWRSGDMSTTEYLLALQQRAEGLAAGIELRTQFLSARIDWLLQTGQILAALQQLK